MCEDAGVRILIREWLRRIREFPFLEATTLRLQKELEEIKTKTTPVGGLDSIPTQLDKPSPSSHLSVEELLTLVGKKFPRSKGWFVSGVSPTNSMEPLIDDNSVVLYEDLRSPQGDGFLDDNPLRVGDVCGYYTEAFGQRVTMVIHQIVEVDVKNGLVKFRGLNNYASDPQWVKEEYVILRAVAVFFGSKVNEYD